MEAPTVYLVPNLSSFSLDGPGSDGIEQGAGYLLGCYQNYCPCLQTEFCYFLYTICFSTTFLEIPPESIYSEVVHRIRPEHWVRFSPFSFTNLYFLDKLSVDGFQSVWGGA